MDEAVAVGPAQRHREIDCEQQKPCRLERPCRDATKWLTSGILEHEHRSTFAADDSQRPGRPLRIQFGCQGIFVVETIENRRGGMLSDGSQHQDRDRITQPAAAVESELSFFPQSLQQVSGKLHWPLAMYRTYWLGHWLASG